MDFFEIFSIGRYHRDMKALKILASNFEHFRIFGTFNKWQIGVLGRHFIYYFFLDNLYFKQPLVLELHWGMFLDSRNPKMTSNGPKTY